MASPNINITNAYPLELHYIKALFLQQRYRQCIQACRDVLKTTAVRMEERPMQQTFINFYLGLAHDELARMMHDCSQAKIPAFRQAEQYYNEAIESLPAPGTALRAHDAPTTPQDDDPFMDSTPPASNDEASPPHEDGEYDRLNYSSPSFTDLSSSPLAHLRNDSLPPRSPPTSSRETSSSDLESHSSFDQIMTPHRVLERDVLSMSLISDTHPPPNAMEPNVSHMSLINAMHMPPAGRLLPKSMSQGLLRPIRPGSPPKAFHVPPRLPYVSSAASTSRLPRLNTRSTWESPSRRMPSAISEEWSSSPPVSPVSPLGSDDAVSDASTISPITPETPARAEPPITHAQPIEETHGGDESARALTSENINAVHIQLNTHLRLLGTAKERTLSAQAARAISRASAAPTTGTPLAPLRASLDGATNSSRPGSSSSKHDSVIGESKRVPPSRSYWSFTPADVKAGQLRKRISEGRERNWEKERFAAKRYAKLAERALAEL